MPKLDWHRIHYNRVLFEKQIGNEKEFSSFSEDIDELDCVKRSGNKNVNVGEYDDDLDENAVYANAPYEKKSVIIIIRFSL